MCLFDPIYSFCQCSSLTLQHLLLFQSHAHTWRWRVSSESNRNCSYLREPPDHEGSCFPSHSLAFWYSASHPKLKVSCQWWLLPRLLFYLCCQCLRGGFFQACPCVMSSSLVDSNALWLESSTQWSRWKTPELYKGYYFSSVVLPVILGECLALSQPSLPILHVFCIWLCYQCLSRWESLGCCCLVKLSWCWQRMFVAYQQSAGLESELPDVVMGMQIGLVSTEGLKNTALPQLH